MNGESTTVASASSGGMSTEIATTSRPRHHHRGDLLRREVEDLVQHLLLGRLELAHVLGGGDAVPDVLARVGDHPGGRGLHPQEPQDDVRRDLERHTSGCVSRASQSSGIASAIASGSAFCSATAFGTSSPSTTER